MSRVSHRLVFTRLVTYTWERLAEVISRFAKIDVFAFTKSIPSFLASCSRARMAFGKSSCQ